MLRVRAVLSALAAAWCWGWSLGVVQVPLALAVVVGAWSAGVGERSISPDASVLSVWLGRVGPVGGAVFANPVVREVLDFDRPIAVMLVALLHFVADSADPAGIVRTLMEAVPPGSHLILSHVTGDFDPARLEISARAYDQSTARLAARSGAEITRFFDGLELLEPGVVLLPRWRPDGEVPEDADSIWMYAGGRGSGCGLRVGGRRRKIVRKSLLHQLLFELLWNERISVPEGRPLRWPPVWRGVAP